MVHPRFVLGSSLVFGPGKIWIVLWAGFLTKSTFANTHSIGGRAYPVRHYPVAIRLRDRKGHAILCIALNPQSGDFSGAILEVPFKALLHAVLSVVSRSSLGKIKQGIREEKRTAILIKSTFSILAFFGSSLVCPWFVVGL